MVSRLGNRSSGTRQNDLELGPLSLSHRPDRPAQSNCPSRPLVSLWERGMLNTALSVRDLMPSSGARRRSPPHGCKNARPNRST
jgi:hypothetical protein